MARFWPSMYPRSRNPRRNDSIWGSACGLLYNRTPRRGIFPGGCARDASGHEAAALPTSVMNSRRLKSLNRICHYRVGGPPMHPTTRMTSSGHWMKPTNNSITKNTAMRQYHVTGRLNATDAVQYPHENGMFLGIYGRQERFHTTSTQLRRIGCARRMAQMGQNP